MAGQVPTAGAILSLIGGIFVLLVGVWLAIIGTAFSFFLGSLTGLFFIGLVVGILIVVFAALMFAAPRMKVAWGALVIVLAIVSLPTALGGFFIGFILALIGGILAITYKPTPTMMAPPMMGAPMGGPVPAACPACGGPIDPARRTCTRCGRMV